MIGVGNYIKKWRESNGYTQKDVAKMVGCHSQMISNIERGAHKKPRTFCLKIQKFMSVRECQLLYEELGYEILDGLELK